MLVPLAHAEVAPGLLLCQNTIAGDAPPYGQQGGTRFRLLVSPVKPWPPQEGAFMVPSVTLVLTAMVVPALNVASDPQQSPKMLNSASFQPCARTRISSLPDAE